MEWITEVGRIVALFSYWSMSESTSIVVISLSSVSLSAWHLNHSFTMLWSSSSYPCSTMPFEYCAAVWLSAFLIFKLAPFEKRALAALTFFTGCSGEFPFAFFKLIGTPNSANSVINLSCSLIL